MDVLRDLNQLRIRVAASKTSAVGYFAVVFFGLVVAGTWVSSSAVAFAGFFLYVVPVPFTWPLLDAAFTRYSKEPVVNAHARERMPWVWCVLVGVTCSFILGGLGG
jgi:hypothetical protein